VKRVGIMLDWSIFEKERAGKRTYECLPYYVEIGKGLGLEPVFFHPSHVNLRTRTVYGHFWNGKKLIPKVVKIPPVIHNRVLSSQAATRTVIRELSRIAKVFNEIVVRDKGKVHRMLWYNPLVRPFLPVTAIYTRQSFLRFLRQYPVIYVKPAIGSIGDGVVRIERVGTQYQITSSTQKKLVSRQGLIEEVSRLTGKRKFLVQQAVPLAKYEGSTFDIRVSVQKNGERKWVVSGMVAKVANPLNKLSNLARGGRAVPVIQVFSKLFDGQKAIEVIIKILKIAVEIAKQYEKFFPSLADLGLDMGVDSAGNPYLIEINVRDQRYSFFKAGELEMFKKTYRHPMEYAKSFYP
jgi:hypothetical protein